MLNQIKITALLVLLIITQTFAVQNAGSVSPAQKAKNRHILHSLQRAYASDFMMKERQTTTRTLSVNEETGSISGYLYGLEANDHFTAWVEAFNEADPSDSAGYSKGISGVDSLGKYSIDGLPPGKYFVLAFAEGYDLLYYPNVINFAEAKPVPVIADQTTEGIDFRMQKWAKGSSVIAGIVTAAETGAPLANAIISCYSPNQPYWYSAASDEQGAYSIPDLAAAEYYIQAWAEGRLVQYYNGKDNFDESDLLAVGDSVTISNIDFKMVKAGSISGTIRDENGNPVFGVTVLVECAFDSMNADGCDWREGSYGKAMSDENGHYLVEGLIGGEYFVRAEFWSQWGVIYEWYDNKTGPFNADRVTVVTGVETRHIDFALSYSPPKGVLFGHVGDEEGNDIVNATVSIQTVDPSLYMPIWASVITDKEGNYRIDGLPNGSYYVSAGVQSSWQYIFRWWPDAQSFEDAQPVVVDDAVEPKSTDFVLPLVIGTASISGRVLADDGHPLAWANINISPASPPPYDGSVTSSVWAWAYTDSTGYYQVDQLPEGDYIAYSSYWESLSFGQQWWDHQSGQETATVIALSKNEKRENVDFDLTVKPMYGSIVGVVMDSLSGKPLARAYVSISTVWQENPNFMRPCFWHNVYAVTDENGFFALDWLYEGDYLVSVYANGAFEYYDNAITAASATPVKVIGGVKSTVDFNVTARRDGKGVISGRVVSEWEKTPFDIAVVTAKPNVAIQLWPFSEMFYTAVTDSSGNFTLEGLPLNTEFVIYAFAAYGVGEYYDNVYDPAAATLVQADGSRPVVLNDIELPVYRWYYYDEAGNNKRTPSNAQLYGRMTDAQGNAIVGGRVVVFNDAGQAVASAQTGVGGYYEIGGLPPGNYYLQASQQGFNTMFNGNVPSMSLAQPVTIGNSSQQLDFNMTSNITGIDDTVSKLPTVPKLVGNFPNPFNPQTKIVFELPKKTDIQLAVYNLKGERVALVVSGNLDEGRHEYVWNGRDDSGLLMSSGLYVYELTASSFKATGKMVLLK